DSSFVSSLRYGISTVASQEDGKVLVGLNPNPAPRPLPSPLVRLNPNGTLDASFNPQIRGPFSYHYIAAIEPLANGKILIAGTFDQVNGLPVQNLARLNSDGSTDIGFQPDVRFGFLPGK